MIELKTPYGEVGPLEQRVHEILIDHNGPICVIGFNPYSHAWFADRYPERAARPGQLRLRDAARRTWRPSSARASPAWSMWRSPGRTSWRWASTCCPAPRADALRAEGMPVVAWTVREPDQWDAVKDHCDNLIFEGFAA